MKKGEILAFSWLRTEPVPVGSQTVMIRELPASAKREVFAELRRMREEGKDEAEVNDFFVAEMVFRSIVDEDGAVVYETEEERAVAMDKTIGLPGRVFTEVFDAVNKLNELIVNPTDEEDKVTDDAKKKSKPNTEASKGSSGSEACAESLDSAA
jgi:hypothetical protein